MRAADVIAVRTQIAHGKYGLLLALTDTLVGISRLLTVSMGDSPSISETEDIGGAVLLANTSAIGDRTNPGLSGLLPSGLYCRHIY